MYLLYLDESGVPENSSEEYFVMGGLAVFERQCYWLSQQLDDLQQKHFPASGFVEFHAQAINAHKKEPWHSISSSVRGSVLDDIYSVIADCHPSSALFSVAFHKPSFPNQDPVAYCFERICSGFDLFLKRLKVQGDRHLGLMILDESKYESRFQNLLSQYRQVGSQFGRVHGFADVPLFADSKATRLLQLADMVSWAVYRRYERGDTKYFDRIVSRFDSEHDRIHGLVHLTGGHRVCMCPACLTRRMAPQPSVAPAGPAAPPAPPPVQGQGPSGTASAP